MASSHFHFKMSESKQLPLNFGGIDEEQYSSFDPAAILVWPVSYEGTVSYGTGTGAGAMAIIDASRNMELYEEETDTEVYKLGIHTLPLFLPKEKPEIMMDGLYQEATNLLRSDKFLCTLGGEHSISGPIIRAHKEKYPNISVLQIDAHADLREAYDGTPHSHASIMSRVVMDMRIPSVQVGIRSISREEALALKGGLPTKIFWARDAAGRIDWIDEAIDSLTDDVYLTIDIDGLDPSIVPTTGTPEPGGLGWYETLTLIWKLAESKKVVGMDLVEYSYVERFEAPAFLCSKLIYKSLSYIFNGKTPKVTE